MSQLNVANLNLTGNHTVNGNLSVTGTMPVTPYASMPTGSVVQMLSCTPVISGYWANQEDWTDLTGMAITITPKASTNKLLLRAQVHQSSAGGDYTSCIGFKKNGSLLSYTTHNNWGYGDYHEYVSDNDNSLSSGTGQCEREEVALGSTSGFDISGLYKVW